MNHALPVTIPVPARRRALVAVQLCGSAAVCLALLASRAAALADDAASAIREIPPAAAPTPENQLAELREAEQALRKFDYARACELYEQITRRSPDNGTHWSNLARCQERLEKYDAAIASLRRSVELGEDVSFGRTELQIARLYAHERDAENALLWIEKSLAARNEHRHALRENSHFEFLRDDPRFQRLAGLVRDGDQLDRAERWRRDLAYLREEAQRMHPLWHVGGRAENFSAALDRLEQRIGELSDQQIVAQIEQALVLLGDGHTHLGATGKVDMGKRLPLRFYFFSDGLFIIDADDAHRDLIGCRVEQVGGVDVERVKELLTAVVSRDNPIGVLWIGPFELTKPWTLRALGLMDAQGPARLAVVDRAGSARQVSLEPTQGRRYDSRLFASRLPDAPPPPKYLARQEKSYWFEPLAGTQAVYVQFNAVGGGAGESLDAFAESLAGHLATARPRTVILDLRHNGGGNTYLYLNLVKTLVHYERDNRDAQLFALIGRNTFSAAQNFTSDVDRWTKAVFVGEPTGSRPNFAGESTRVMLPYSGLGMSISTRWHQHSYPTDSRIWIAPDVAVPLSSADYFAGRDPALEAVLRMAGIPADQAAELAK